MGKKRGNTNSGRSMNPADRERKQARLKELKKNKKQRSIVRQAIVKSRNPEELIEQLQHLDDQEFDPSCKLAPNVIADKREKYKGAFIQMLSLYRTEKNDKKVAYLQNLLNDYEQDRHRKEQHFKAVQFSQSADPTEIPLPSGSMLPNAAMTPFIPPPMPPTFHPTMIAKASILKKPVQKETKPHKYPPGPPCGLPPDLSEYDDDYEDDYSRNSYSNRKVRFNEEPQQPDYQEDEDLEPVEIPEEMMDVQREVPMYQTAMHMPPLMSAPPIPPNMVPPPPIIPGRMPIPPTSAPRPDFSAPYGRGPAIQSRQRPHDTVASVISAAPQVNKSKSDVPASGAVIAAEPQLRNMKKEATRFVPTTLRIHRSPTQQPKPKPIQSTQNRTVSGIATQAKSTDEACEEFLREIQDLL